MDLLFARWQMGLSLAFHIVFAVIGMAMPVMMIAAKVAWVRTGRSEYLDLAKRRAHLTLAEGAALENVRVILLQVLGVGAVVLIPSVAVPVWKSSVREAAGAESRGFVSGADGAARPTPNRKRNPRSWH
jgi:bd-type cytochrome oxidase subunit I